MKPKLFIGSSAERLNLAYAAQQNLERDAEVTVWDQGIFTPSGSVMESLMTALGRADFALFVLAPDDVTAIRDKSRQTVRDNVIFELGLFIGRMGAERCFMAVPRGVSALHLPTDLLGLTPTTFEAERSDDNLRASLGPACNEIRNVISKLGSIPTQQPRSDSVAATQTRTLYSDPSDCLILIESWMGRRTSAENTAAIRYDDVDRELGMAPGSARLHIEQAARRWSYSVARQGKDMIMFEEGEERY
jgi:hypothetical protein